MKRESENGCPFIEPLDFVEILRPCKLVSFMIFESESVFVFLSLLS